MFRPAIDLLTRLLPAVSNTFACVLTCVWLKPWNFILPGVCFVGPSSVCAWHEQRKVETLLNEVVCHILRTKSVKDNAGLINVFVFGNLLIIWLRLQSTVAVRVQHTLSVRKRENRQNTRAWIKKSQPQSDTICVFFTWLCFQWRQINVMLSVYRDSCRTKMQQASVLSFFSSKCSNMQFQSLNIGWQYIPRHFPPTVNPQQAICRVHTRQTRRKDSCDSCSSCLLGTLTLRTLRLSGANLWIFLNICFCMFCKRKSTPWHLKCDEAPQADAALLWVSHKSKGHFNHALYRML